VDIALVHNEGAGKRVYAADDLVRFFQEAGHHVELFGKSNGAVRHAIGTRPQVVVASGGDGTVATVAIALRESAVPMFILPTGTSNNIARAVGVDRAIPMLVKRLWSARETRFDVGRIAGDGFEGWFVEAVGAGFIGAMLREDEQWWRHAWRRIRDRFPYRDHPRVRSDGEAANQL
jgi:diacylglycerol kinase (ATP)